MAADIGQKLTPDTINLTLEKRSDIAADSGVQHQDVDDDPSFLENLPHGIDMITAADIARDINDLEVLVRELSGEFRGGSSQSRGATAANDDLGGSCLGEPTSDGIPDSRRSTGDNDCLTHLGEFWPQWRDGPGRLLVDHLGDFEPSIP